MDQYGDDIRVDLNIVIVVLVECYVDCMDILVTHKDTTIYHKPYINNLSCTPYPYPYPY